MRKYLIDYKDKFFIPKAVSAILHPVVFSLLIPFAIIYKESNGNFWYSIRWMGFSSIFLFLAIFLMFLLRPKEFFTDFDVSKREKRGLFYTIVAISALLYFMIAVFFKGFLFPLSIVALGIVIGCVLMEVLNMILKVSVHTTVATAFLMTLGILYGIQAFVFFSPIIPLVIWSRLKMRKHTLKEVVVGMVIGEVITALTFVVAKVLQ